MSELDKLLGSHVPPPVPADLAARAAAEAVKHPQAPRLAAPHARRRDRRGGWRRPLWIGTASFGLAFTSAVAATVASGGRIEIPVVKQVVAAIPILAVEPAPQRKPERLVRAEPKPTTPAATDTPLAASPQLPQDLRQRRVLVRLAEAKRLVEERRAAGLPTPRADRIERQAQRIVERRQAAGLPTPPVEQVEAGLALREMRRMQAAASGLGEQRIRRLIERLPPEKRARFEQLSPEQQQAFIQRWIQRRLARQQAALAGAEPAPPVDGEGFSEPSR